MQGETTQNYNGLPLYHLQKIGPGATKEGVSDTMDFLKVTTIIGRQTNLVDYVLDSNNGTMSKYISRRHARVIRKENNDHCIHDDSMNGIYVNDIKLSGSVILRDGDRVTFGHRKGRRIQPGERVVQLHSEYQFVFERCNCNHNCIANQENHIDIRTNDSFTCHKNTNALLPSDRNRDTAERNSVNTCMTEMQTNDNVIHDDGNEQSMYLSNESSSVTELYKTSVGNQVRLTPQKSCLRIPSPYVVMTSPISDFDPEGDLRYQSSVLESEPNINSPSKRNFPKMNPSPEKCLRILNNKGGRSDHDEQNLVASSKLDVSLQTSPGSDFQIEFQYPSQEKNTVVYGDRMASDVNSRQETNLLTSPISDMGDLNIDECNNTLRNGNKSERKDLLSNNHARISVDHTSPATNDNDFETALADLRDIINVEEINSMPIADNADYDSILSDLENIVKNNISDKSSRSLDRTERRKVIWKLVSNYFKFREGFIKIQQVCDSSCLKQNTVTDTMDSNSSSNKNVESGKSNSFNPAISSKVYTSNVHSLCNLEKERDITNSLNLDTSPSKKSNYLHGHKNSIKEDQPFINLVDDNDDDEFREIEMSENCDIPKENQKNSETSLTNNQINNESNTKDSLKIGDNLRMTSDPLLDTSFDEGESDSSFRRTLRNIIKRSVNMYLFGENSGDNGFIPDQDSNCDNSGVLPLSLSNQNSHGVLPLSGSYENDHVVLPLSGSDRDNHGVLPLSGSDRDNHGVLPLSGSDRDNHGVLPLSQSKQDKQGVLPLSGSKQDKQGVLSLSGSKQDKHDVLSLSGLNCEIGNENCIEESVSEPAAGNMNRGEKAERVDIGLPKNRIELPRDGEIRIESNDLQFLFKEQPISSVKVKQEEEYVSRKPRYSWLLPDMEFEDESNRSLENVLNQDTRTFFDPCISENLSDESEEKLPEVTFLSEQEKGQDCEIDEIKYFPDDTVMTVTVTPNHEEMEQSSPQKTPKFRSFERSLKMKAFRLSQKIRDKIKTKPVYSPYRRYKVQVKDLLLKFRTVNSPIKDQQQGVKKDEIAASKKKILFQNSEIELLSADSDTDSENGSKSKENVTVMETSQNSEKVKVNNINKAPKGKFSYLPSHQKTKTVNSLSKNKSKGKKNTKSHKNGTQNKSKDNNLSNWLLETLPKKLPYIPQIGDIVVYFRQGHQQYINKTKKNNRAKTKPYPWEKYPFLKEEELVWIEDIKFEGSHPTLCCLNLACIDPVTNLTTGESFNVIYHDMPNVIDFFVLKQNYDIAVNRNWKVGNRFCSIIEDKWWTGTILTKKPFEPDFPNSMFQCFNVRWDSGEKEPLSPWDMEPIQENRMASVIGEGVPVNQDQLKSLVYTPQPGDWPFHDIDVTCDRIVKGINLLMNHRIIKDATSRYNITRKQARTTTGEKIVIQYAINLQKIRKRLRSRFYRRLNAVKFDVGFFQTNAEKLGNPDVTKAYGLLTEALLTFISDEKCSDPIPILEQLYNQKYNSEYTVSGDIHQATTGIKRTNSCGEGIRKKQKLDPVTYTSDWKTGCHKLIDMLCESFEEISAAATDTLNEDLETSQNSMNFENIREKLNNGNYSGPLELSKDVQNIFQLLNRFYSNGRFGISLMIMGMSGMFDEGIKELLHKQHNSTSENSQLSVTERHNRQTNDNESFTSRSIEFTQGTSTDILSTSRIFSTACIPAPQECFKQWEIPPTNEFKLNMKLEAVDIRNSTSICIATVVGLYGPRLLLRLDGSDDRNDFWRLVDSSEIHPFGHCAKIGQMILPPLGFLTCNANWNTFLEKTISDAYIAPASCFKETPPSPKCNKFKVGMKLEAVDQKNPYLICPATVGDVSKDKILVTFDGWQDTNEYWCRYDSRDIFPVGWCKRSGYFLQAPGSKGAKEQTKQFPGRKFKRSTSQQVGMKNKCRVTFSRSLSTPELNHSLSQSDHESVDSESSSSSGIESGSENSQDDFLP